MSADIIITKLTDSMASVMIEGRSKTVRIPDKGSFDTWEQAVEMWSTAQWARAKGVMPGVYSPVIEWV